ncbi:MAG: hypothetical protein P4M00_13145 [Azospirillaceae bacterium]|nr:hypothetical protein [Azospirillaceae bacterium]
MDASQVAVHGKELKHYDPARAWVTSATGIASLTAIALFALLLISNAPTLTHPFIPGSDYAADILATQRAAHGLLLTGHPSVAGFNHPGPFFLYFRILAQWLIGDLTATVFGAHLVGVFACSALFAGLFAALLHGLARQEGADDRTATIAALGALAVILMQFGTIGAPGDDFVPRVAFARGVLSNIWMPDVLILPFLTFLTAALLALRGSTFGLIAATGTAGALVHGYIMLPPIVGPVWLITALLARRARRAVTGQDFSGPTWLAVIGIITLFALPLLLDAVLHPPGNIALALATAVDRRVSAPSPPLLTLVRFLCHQWWDVRPGLWAAIPLGLAICAATHRHRAVCRGTFLLLSLVAATALLAFTQTPWRLPPFSARFFLATALLPIALGVLFALLALQRNQGRLGASTAAALVFLFPLTTPLYLPYRGADGIDRAARAIAAEVPPGSQIALSSAGGQGAPSTIGASVINLRTTGASAINLSTTGANGIDPNLSARHIPVIAGVLLDLDRFGIVSCAQEPIPFYYSAERICAQPLPPGTPVYQIDVVVCPADPPPPFERVGSGIMIMPVAGRRDCVQIVPAPR